MENKEMEMNEQKQQELDSDKMEDASGGNFIDDMLLKAAQIAAPVQEWSDGILLRAAQGLCEGDSQPSRVKTH